MICMSNNKLKIGVSQGDVNGIGWEIILKSFADERMMEICTPIIYGSHKAAMFHAEKIAELPKVDFHTITKASDAHFGKVNLIETGDVQVRLGQATQEAGKAAVDALRRAAEDLKAGSIDALVTAPFSKESVQSDDFRFTGHTEFMASEFDGEPMMIMCSERMKVGLVTIHIPVSEVSQAISKERIEACLDRLQQSLIEDFGVVKPRIAVLSLNPHAGDGGLLGDEEQQVIKPAIEQAFSRGVLAFGPFAADGLFAGGAYAKYDAVLAMYHDQGLTPFKTLSPDGVNFTAGLGVVRTSPDHGVAYDIAGKDRADSQSMRNAIYAAIDIARQRGRYDEWSSNPLRHYERDKGRDVSVKDLPEEE